MEADSETMRFGIGEEDIVFEALHQPTWPDDAVRPVLRILHHTDDGDGQSPLLQDPGCHI